eukprot:GEMP01086735.1.p1 GENE.GEMP01086735.1~~GEMP01086735.1.p1  ORF type:complete len:179 (+),score=23.38 GEMP01086735.1:61-537(+)
MRHLHSTLFADNAEVKPTMTEITVGINVDDTLHPVNKWMETVTTGQEPTNVDDILRSIPGTNSNSFFLGLDKLSRRLAGMDDRLALIKMRVESALQDITEKEHLEGQIDHAPQVRGLRSSMGAAMCFLPFCAVPDHKADKGLHLNAKPCLLNAQNNEK